MTFGVCSEKVLTGNCSRRSCRFSHDLTLFCRPCTQSFSNANQATRHLKSRQHKQLLLDCVPTCPACNEDVPAADWAAHCGSTSHQSAASRSIDWVDPPFPVYKNKKLTEDGCKRCDVCHSDVYFERWEIHVQSTAHRVKRLMTVPPRRLTRARNVPRGIWVSHFEDGLDFGVVEVPRGAASVSRTRGLMLTVKGAGLQLEGAAFTSVIEGRSDVETHPFKVSLPSQALSMALRGRPLVNVTFTARDQPGAFSDRIELRFLDTRMQYRFIIWRRIVAEVGNQKDLEDLRPRSEYVPPPRVVPAADPVQLKTRGEPYSDGFKIKWAKKLPEFPVPEDLRKVLSGDRKGLTNAVKRQFLPPTFTLGTYGKFWSALLHVEEIQQEIDLAGYSMEGVHITKEGRLYYRKYPIPVGGLAEKRPSVIVGDLIKIKLNKEKVIHGGYVHKVRDAGVLLSLHYDFPYMPRLEYDVQFTLNRLPSRRQHQAVLSVDTTRGRILFPTWNDIKPAAPEASFTPLDRKMEANASQLSAVSRILSMSPGSAPFVIFGPFGTGKTTTLVEAIQQLHFADPDIRILACAPSNAAADAIAFKLKNLGAFTMLRLNATSREYERTLSPEMKTFHDEYSLVVDVETVDGREKRFRLPTLKELRQYNIVVSTCVSAGVPIAAGVPKGHYDWIFVDEAGQASEPEVVIPILTLADNLTNIVLCGDPRQLGPIIHSPVSRNLGHGTSFLERLMSMDMYDEAGDKGQRGLTVVKLLHNFRNHPSILKFPNDSLYRSELVAAANPMMTGRLRKWEKMRSETFPILFHGVIGVDKREGSSPSYFNPHEVLEVRNLVEDLLTHRQLGIRACDIGIIAPYSAQCSKLRQSMMAPRYAEVKIGSVEEFQGQERPVIFISTTRSSDAQVVYDLRHQLGFVANPRRLNVALTRAIAGLVIVGNPKILSLDPLWRSLINYIHLNGGYKGPRLDWDMNEVINFVDEGFYARVRSQEAVSRMEALERRTRGEVLARRGHADEEAFSDEEDQVLFVAGAEGRMGWADNL